MIKFTVLGDRVVRKYTERVTEKEKNVIKRIGSDTKGYWEVQESFSE